MATISWTDSTKGLTPIPRTGGNAQGVHDSIATPRRRNKAGTSGGMLAGLGTTQTSAGGAPITAPTATQTPWQNVGGMLAAGQSAMMSAANNANNRGRGNVPSAYQLLHAAGISTTDFWRQNGGVGIKDAVKNVNSGYLPGDRRGDIRDGLGSHSNLPSDKQAARIAQYEASLQGASRNPANAPQEQRNQALKDAANNVAQNIAQNQPTEEQPQMGQVAQNLGVKSEPPPQWANGGSGGDSPSTTMMVGDYSVQVPDSVDLNDDAAVQQFCDQQAQNIERAEQDGGFVETDFS